MFIRSISLAAILVLSTSVNATLITHGNLTTDDTTSYITDTLTSRQYSRFDAFNMTYAETVSAVSTGGAYDGWSIATSAIADDFYSAALGTSTTPCTGATSIGTTCGSLTGWSDGDFGESYTSSYDYFWYLSTNDTPGRYEYPIGLGEIRGWSSMLRDIDDWSSIYSADYYGGANTQYPINALLYRDTAAVPAPPIAWLFASGLFAAGILRVAKRKNAL